MSADEVTSPRIHGKTKEAQRICGGEGKAVLTIVVEAIELSRDVVDTKGENAKLVERVNDLERNMQDVWSVE